MDDRRQALVRASKLLKQRFYAAERQVDQLGVQCREARKDDVAGQFAAGRRCHARGCFGLVRSMTCEPAPCIVGTA